MTRECEKCQFAVYNSHITLTLKLTKRNIPPLVSYFYHVTQTNQYNTESKPQNNLHINSLLVKQSLKVSNRESKFCVRSRLDFLWDWISGMKLHEAWLQHFLWVRNEWITVSEERNVSVKVWDATLPFSLNNFLSIFKDKIEWLWIIRKL